MLNSLFNLLVGTCMLYFGAEWIVKGSSRIASKLGISSLVIGLTVVAFGTSLPELIVSILSALEGSSSIAVGNVVGSNIFNLLGVMAIPALISPVIIEADALWRDYGLMLLLTLFLLALGFKSRHGGTITRLMGSLLLLIYAMYMLLLYTNAT